MFDAKALPTSNRTSACRADGCTRYQPPRTAKITTFTHSGYTVWGLTERVLKAMRSPHVDAIGHLTGRILGWREGLDLDVELATTAEQPAPFELLDPDGAWRTPSSAPADRGKGGEAGNAAAEICDARAVEMP